MHPSTLETQADSCSRLCKLRSSSTSSHLNPQGLENTRQRLHPLIGRGAVSHHICEVACRRDGTVLDDGPRDLRRLPGQESIRNKFASGIVARVTGKQRRSGKWRLKDVRPLPQKKLATNLIVGKSFNTLRVSGLKAFDLAIFATSSSVFLTHSHHHKFLDNRSNMWAAKVIC